jgi:kynurenine formamidase
VREIPDQPLTPWTPPSYSVNAAGKVEGARPDGPHNWGRWGDDDQKGTANLLTPERVAAAAKLIRTGKRFALGIPIAEEAPGYRPPPLHLFRHATGDRVVGVEGPAGLQVSDDYVVIALQASTQLDGFGHFAYEDLLYNGYWAGLVTGSGARRLGIHKMAEGIVGRGVLLDAARQVGVDRLEKGFAVDPPLLDETARTQGVEVGHGDIVLVRTGHIGWWYALEDKNEFLAGGPAEPGLSVDSVTWFHERDVAMVATDTLAAEVLPPDPNLPLLSFHRGALRDLGLPIGEMFDLDELAADCASDGVYEFFFAAMPLPVVGGVGSPINPVAIK